MFASLINNKDEVNEILDDELMVDNSSGEFGNVVELTTEDWENIEGLNILLEVIGETLCLLEKESNPTLPDAFPNIYILYHFIIEELNIDKELMKIAKESI